MSVEDKQKAITDIEGQIKEIEERKCETPEEVEARNADLEKAASQFEGAINELKEVRRLEELRTFTGWHRSTSTKERSKSSV